MTNSNAPIFAAVIAASAAIISVVASLFVARATVKGKLNELKQVQIGDIIDRRIACYPSLWSLCQENITRPGFKEHATQVFDGWASRLSDGLETWHTQYGVFLSQSSYEALHSLRKKARIFAEESVTATAALGGPLGDLEQIWTSCFVYKGKRYDYGLATCLKNDLGSYAQAEFSQ